MSTELAWDGWPSGYGRVILAETDSTNAEAARRLPQSDLPIWILALRQTRARGRRGRNWVSLNGNFGATLLHPPMESFGAAPQLGFVAGLALFDALVAVTGNAEQFALKWPNDVLLQGGKLAGVLLESLGQGSTAGHLAIGIGVNLAEAPLVDDLEVGALRPVSLVGGTGHLVTPTGFLAALAPTFAAWETKYMECGFRPVREAWLARAARLGGTVTARLLSEEVTGVFETIDATGSLVLRAREGCRAIAAADVYF